MRPAQAGIERLYVAEGEWDLLGKNEGRLESTVLGRNLEMVAGARNAPKPPLPDSPLSI